MSSCGGHLTELLALRGAFMDKRCFFVINSPISLPPEMVNRTVCIKHSERDIYFFLNLLEAWKIISRTRPSFILSTGAGPAIPFFIVGKLLGIRTIYVETLASINSPSLTGRLAYFFVDRFYIRYAGLKKFFPRAILFNAN